MTFEGRCGPSVDELPEAFKNLTDDECFDLEERYENEPIFRREIGPNIPLWANCGELYCLDNLQIDIDFGHFGEYLICTAVLDDIILCSLFSYDHIICLLNHHLIGKVRGIVKDDDSKLTVDWRLGPDFNAKDAFVSKHRAKEIIGLYFRDKDKSNYDWFDYIKPMKESAINFIQSIRDAPEGTTFVDWKRPTDFDEYFENINDEEKWDNTLARLNDPRMAHHYPNDKYPTLALLALYSICVNAGFSLPIMVTEANAQMFKLSDAMCRQVTGTRGWSTGYGNLIAFENITKKILEDYPPNKANSLYKVWKEGYCHAQALMLVLSDEFEQAMWDYDMCDDPERVENLLGSFLKVFVTYMNPDNAPTDTAREQLEKDLDFNNQHLRAGRFMSDAKEYHNELYQSFVKCIKDDEE